MHVNANMVKTVCVDPGVLVFKYDIDVEENANLRVVVI